jgi:hypothetical protein
MHTYISAAKPILATHLPTLLGFKIGADVRTC